MEPTPGPTPTTAWTPEERSADSLWRRYGESLFAVLTFCIFAAEGAALGYLTWALLFRSGPEAFQLFGFRDALVGTVALTALSVTVVTGSVVIFRSASTRRELRRAEDVAAWRQTWRRTISGGAEPPTGPLPEAAVAALLDVREEMTGVEADRATALVFITGVDRLLVARLSAIPAAGHRRWYFRLPGGSHRLATALDTLDDLAKARLPEAVPALLTLFGRRETAVRRMAIRAATRSIAVMPPGTERDGLVMRLLDEVSVARFARGVLEEALLLLEDASESLITAVLGMPAAEPGLVAPCLDSAGRLGLTELAPSIGHRLSPDQHVEVRAAALRCLAALSTLPEGARPDLRAALSSLHEIERIQATRAAFLLPAPEAVPALDKRLGDRSWWVRRAAAESLLRVPDEGVPALLRAARRHPDRFARDMARQVLQDRGIVDEEVGRADIAAGRGRR